MILVLVVTAVLGAAVFSASVSNSRLAQRYKESVQAFWLAEAGLNRAIKELGVNYNQSGSNLWLSSLGEGEYCLEVSFDGPNRLVKARGFIPSMSQPRVERVIEALIGPEITSPFKYAAFAEVSVTMDSNAGTNSYDSSSGPYDNNNPNYNGDVGTNGSSVSLNSNAKIYGDVGTGPGGSVSLGSNAKVTGDITDDTNEEMASVTVPSSLTDLSSGGNYYQDKGTHIISSGNYRYGQFKLNSNAKVIIDGQVNLYLTATGTSFILDSNSEITLNSGASLTIYSDGKCQFKSNAKVNNGGSPTDVILYSTYSGSGNGLNLNSNNAFYGAIYAPDAYILLNSNAKIFGSIVGDAIHMDSNAKIHYDEALTNVGSGSSETVIHAWREILNPYPLNQ